MPSRQTALLENHIDVAALGTTSTAPVCVILDLEEKVAFEIASFYHPNCAQNRDTGMPSGIPSTIDAVVGNSAVTLRMLCPARIHLM